MHRARHTLSLLAAGASAVNLRPAADGPGQPLPECHVLMQNNDEVDYTVSVKIGGQSVNIIPDTGSFPMVLFSDSCDSCGKRSTLLHPDTVTNFRKGSHHAVQSYGSGDTYSEDAYAPAQVHCEPGSYEGPKYIRASEQMFWMTVRANLPVAQESDFQGILGLGPPSSDEKMASRRIESARKEVKQMKDTGLDVSKYMPLLKDLQSVAEFTKTVKPWLQNKGMVAFSVCLRKKPGQHGTLIYNDRKSLQNPGLFSKMVMDKRGPYWQTSFTAVKLGDTKEPKSIQTKGSTQAILDTGTSLIGAPAWFVDEVAAFVEAKKRKVGCDDLSKWPALEFTLGGVKLALPASGYLGKIGGDALLENNTQLNGRMPHLKASSECTAMVFSTSYDDVEDNELEQKEDFHARVNATPGVLQELSDHTSPQWIFGLPFFRSYYSTFLLSKDSMDARQVFLAEADGDCNVMGKPGTRSQMKGKADFEYMDAGLPGRSKFAGPVAIDPRKLRFPVRGAVLRRTD